MAKLNVLSAERVVVGCCETTEGQVPFVGVFGFLFWKQYRIYYFIGLIKRVTVVKVKLESPEIFGPYLNKNSNFTISSISTFLFNPAY